MKDICLIENFENMGHLKREEDNLNNSTTHPLNSSVFLILWLHIYFYQTGNILHRFL